ncbi:hypothetical protein HK405_013445, partial [Cladochytrium tenue]
DNVDYMATERLDGEVVCCFALQTMRDMDKELDHRNPNTHGLQATDEFIKLAEVEVIENQLRVVMKQYKNASKKKAPFSAWRAVLAHLEAMTLFIRHAGRDAWATPAYESPEAARRAKDLYVAVGAAWVSTADRLVAMASLSEAFMPSMRTAIMMALAMGTSLGERFPTKISRWPEKLESLWTGVPLIGETSKDDKKKDDDETKPKKASKKKKDGDDDDEVADGKKKKGHPVRAHQKVLAKPGAPSSMDMWDFEMALEMLKAGRKHIGGTAFDIEIWPAEERERIAAAAVAAAAAAPAVA